MAGVSRRRGTHTTCVDAGHRTDPDGVERQVQADATDRIRVAEIERHEALLNLAVVRDNRHRSVAAGRSELRAPDPGDTGEAGSSPDNDGTRQHCQMVRVRQARRKGVRKEPAAERLPRRNHQLKSDGYGLGRNARPVGSCRPGNSVAGRWLWSTGPGGCRSAPRGNGGDARSDGATLDVVKGPDTNFHGEFSACGIEFNAFLARMIMVGPEPRSGNPLRNRGCGSDDGSDERCEVELQRRVAYLHEAGFERNCAPRPLPWIGGGLT